MTLRPGDASWAEFLQAAPAHSAFQAHVSDAYDVTNILFSSGTTGGAGAAFPQQLVHAKLATYERQAARCWAAWRESHTEPPLVLSTLCRGAQSHPLDPCDAHQVCTGPIPIACHGALRTSEPTL